MISPQILAISQDLLALAPEIIKLFQTEFRAIETYDSPQKHQDITTQTDLEIEQLVRKRIQSKHNLEIDSEENPCQKKKVKLPVVRIDPLDGTKHFALGIEIFSCAISLNLAGETLFGLVINPVSKRVYWAYKQGGAYLNGRQLHVNKLSLERSFVFYEQPHPEAEGWRLYSQLVVDLDRTVFRMRNIGNSSLSLAYVAQGSASVFVNLSKTTKLYDVEAGLLIANEAGAKIYSLEGVELSIDELKTKQAKKFIDELLIVGNSKAARQVIKQFKQLT